MKHRLYKYLLPTLVAQALALCGVQGVTVTVTPNAVSAGYSGMLTLQIEDGLIDGETVIVEQFIDFNGNGAIDPGEPLAMSFRLTAGQASVIDGVVNVNVPRDLNPDPAEITGLIPSLGEFGSIAAHYVFRVSSPTGRFAATTAVFAVNDANHPQSVSGVVRGGGAGLPYAIVALIGAGDVDELAAGAVADATGNFSISAPDGDYMVLAIRDGYLMGEPAFINLADGATVTQDLDMAEATRVISGRLVDADDPGIGLPGVALFLESDEGFTLVYTGGGGNFSALVSPGEWRVEVSEQHLARLGYVGFEEMVDAGEGDVTGLELALPKVTALFYGYLKDNEGNPLAGIEIFAGGQEVDLEAIGRTDEAGYYVVGVVAGQWWIGPSDEELAERGFIAPGANRGLSDGQAVRVDFEATGFTAFLSGRVVDQNGGPIGDHRISASNWMDGGWSSTRTDEDGNFTLGVFAGTWNLELDSLEAADRGLVKPSLTFEVTDGVDVTDIVYVAHTVAADISGWVRQADGKPVGSVGVFAFATLDGVTYNVWVETNGEGTFSFGVIHGTWVIGVSGNDLADLGFGPVSDQTVLISNGGGTAHFTVSELEPLEVATTALPGGTAGAFYSVNLEASGGVPPYQWSFAPGSALLPPGLSLDGNSISGTPEITGTSTFTVQVSDWVGESATRTLSLTIEGGESVPLRFASINPLAGGEVDLTLEGEEGINYVIRATSGLSNPFWVEVGAELAGSGGIVVFRDSTAVGFRTRFYQAEETPAEFSVPFQVWGVSFEPYIEVTPCNSGAGLFWSSQALVPDSAGRFETLWPPGAEPVVRVYGSISETTFNATLECYPGGTALMTLTASRQGESYLGSFAGGSFSVAAEE